MKLVFGKANSKLKALEQLEGGKLYTFSLLSGHNCPGAKDCKSMAVIGNDGKAKIQDGPDTLFRCFSASNEVLFPSVYQARLKNAEIVKLASVSIPLAVQSLSQNIPKNAKIIRLHVGGDFATRNYFEVWMEVIRRFPKIKFYAYTKSLFCWVPYIHRGYKLPENLSLTASYGGKYDYYIEEYNLRYAKVVGSVEEAESLGLPIDHDDSHALNPVGNFALLIHGTQPKGSIAAKNKSALKGLGSYPSKVKGDKND